MVFSRGHILECGFRGPGNEGLPAKRASRQPGSPGNEGLPATRVSRQRGPPGNEGFRQRGLPRLWPFSGGHILEKRPPRDRPRMCSKSFILWQNLTWQNPASISRIQVLTGKPLPGGPGNEGLPATRVSRQRGPPGNEGLPATRSSRQRGFPATRASPAVAV